MLLKRLMERAYSSSTKLDEDVTFALELMLDRLKLAGPKTVGKNSVAEWFVFTDAAYETDDLVGGLGGVLVASDGTCKGWFGLKLSAEQCEKFWFKEQGHHYLRAGNAGCVHRHGIVAKALWSILFLYYT